MTLYSQLLWYYSVVQLILDSEIQINLRLKYLRRSRLGMDNNCVKVVVEKLTKPFMQRFVAIQTFVILITTKKKNQVSRQVVINYPIY